MKALLGVCLTSLGALGASALAPACATGAVDPSVVSDVSGTTPAEGRTGDDCAGVDPTRRRDVPEMCNGKDDDCNGWVDDGFDRDGDGWVSCAVGTKPADCDDTDPSVHPTAAEVCNGKDDNCDGKIDEALDQDNDGFATCPNNGLPADCDDSDRNVSPGASERCNGKDDDCDGKIDELPASLNGSLSFPVDSHWALAGSATFNSGWVQLTPDQTYKTGALWWSGSYTFDTFDVSATVWMPARQDCADGVAFAFVPGNDLTAVGGPGWGHGVLGLSGFGVVLDTFSNQGEPPAPFVVVMNAYDNAQLVRQAIPEIRNAQEHQLRVRLDGGKISVWLDAVNYIFEFPIPGYTPFIGHWGFTAATGGQSCTALVKDVAMSFPNGQGCVP